MSLRTALHRAAVAAALSWRAAPGAAAVALALTALTGALPVVAAWALKLLLDELTQGSGAAGRRFVVAIAMIAGAGLVGAAVAHIGGYLGGVLRRALRLTVQERLFARVNALEGLTPFEDPAFLDRLRLAEQAGERAPDEVVTASVTALRSVVQAGGFVATLLIVWPPMVPLVLIAAVPAMVLQLRISRRRAELAEDLSPRMRRQIFYRGLLTDVRAAKEIRLFGLGPFLHGRMLAELRHANDAEAALDRRVHRTELSLELLGALIAAVGFAAAGLQAIHGRLSIGDVSVFFAAVGGVTAAVASAVSAIATTHGSLLLFGSYVAIVEESSDAGPPRATASVDPAEGSRTRAGIEFRDVWFRYSDDAPWVLRGASFTIPHRRAVGLVGLNGAGKSTIVKLLCRMYQPQRGSIQWDGVDLNGYPVAALRQRISAVFQDFMAYDLSASENIGLGWLEYRDDLDRIRAAARLADVDATLADLPRGYATLLSRIFPGDADDQTGSAVLSGGQWQRVALARAFLRHDAELLILDEPSSGLDAEAEYALQTRLRALRTDRTSLLISHRLATIRDADLIVVLEAGRVVEQGRHDELLARAGVYARLFRLQSAAYQDVRLNPVGVG